MFIRKRSFKANELLERKIQYDPVKKYNRILSSKLISKIPKVEKNPVPTRPKQLYTFEGELPTLKHPAKGAFCI